jgi:hypothetical protein
MPYGYGSSASFSPSSSSSSSGGNARESYGGGGQYQQTTAPTPTPSVTTGGGNSGVDPGFVRALDEQARRQADPVYGDPDPYIDDPISERDTITSFLDNYAANVASNPFELGLIGALKTSYQTNKAKEMMRGTPGYEFLDYGLRDNSVARGDEGGQELTNIISQAPFAISGTTPTQSMVQDYFANLESSSQSALSPKLESDYNAAKQTINNLLNITPVSQQFGYSADPYGGLLASNLQTNPFNIEYLRTRGLI